MKKLILLLALAFCLKGNAQIITTVAGNGLGAGTATCCYGGDGGQATAAEFNYPSGVTFDISGNMYIVDQKNHRIRKVTTAGIISTIAGTGTGGFSGDGGQATAAELHYPYGIAFDASGNLYIADYSNFRIRKISSQGIITTVVGNGYSPLGYGSFGGDGGQATNASLSNPVKVTFDIIGNMYIADAGNNRIRKVNTSGIITTIAGNGTSGQSGDGGQATAAELYGPDGIAIDATGMIYITDPYGIRMINTSGIITTIAGNGTQGYNGDGGQATNAELYAPSGVTVDTYSNLYISDGNNVIRKVNTAGIITTIIGNGIAGYSGDGGIATAAELNEPYETVLDGSGSNIYIVDVGNNRIRKVTLNCGECAGIEQYNITNELTIYPNPNNGSFFIEQSNATKQTMQVYDVNGKLVLNQTITGKTNIDASSLNEGVYNISLQSNEGVVNKRLVIIR